MQHYNNCNNENISVILGNKGKWLIGTSPHIIILELLTRRDKSKLVIELYKQDKNIRQIAKEVHMSFGDISTIIKREFPEEEHITKDTEVLKAFAKGERLLDIAIKFNMPANEVERLHREYRSLSGMDELNNIHKDLGADIEHFVQLYSIMKKQNLSYEEIIKAIRYGNDLQLIELEYEKVKEEVKRLGAQKQNLLSETENLEDVIALSRTVKGNLDQVIEQKTREVNSLDCRRKKHQERLLEIMISKEYRKVKDRARQQVENTLRDKRPLLSVTLVAIIEAFKLDPEKQILILNLPRHGGYYLEQQREELLELAEQIHNKLANDMVNATLNSVFDKEAVSFSISP